MSADKMTAAELITYHALRVREAVRQTEDPQVRTFGDALMILDHITYAHAREAAHAAGERG